MKDYNRRQRQRRDIEIDIFPILKTISRRVWLMILVGVIVGGAVFGVTKLLIKPTYRCGFTAYVNNQQAQADKSMLTNSDLVASQQLTKTFSYIIRSNSVLSASLKSINSDLTYAQFSGMVSTEIKDETELISVFVLNEDPQTAYDLANAIAETAPSYMSNIVEGSSMKIVDYPVFSAQRFKPSYLKFALLGFIFGFLFIAVIEIIRYFKDDSVKDENELEMRFTIPVLGVIPDINRSDHHKSSGYYSSDYGYSYAHAHHHKDKDSDKEGKEA